MKQHQFESPRRLLDGGVVLYPVVPRYIPRRRARLEGWAHELSALRADGRTIAQLRLWVYQRTEWLPSDSAMYRLLAKLRESGT